MEQSGLVALLNQMSLKEKVDQMLQLRGDFYLMDPEAVITGPAQDLGITQEDIDMAGTILGAYGAENLMKIQKAYMEKQPHHIPLIFMLDVIHGMRTIYPMPLAQGATFDPELVKSCAEMAAKEAAVSGLHLTFSPMVDLVRDARWGRVMESTGEDPYLNGKMAKAMVEGYQGDDLSDKEHVAACVKHFAAYGGANAGRDYNTVELSEYTLRESYLTGYQAAIDAGAATVMTSFNTVNGVPASTNKWLMRDILRDEMGFDGVLISDYAAIAETIAHGTSADERDAARKAMEAGVDIDMVTNVYTGQLCDLVEKGDIAESLIDEAVLRILELKNKLGLFENPYKGADPEKEKEVILCEEHRKLAQRAAEESFVLLKNRNILPIQTSQKTAFIGPYTDNKEMLSAWAISGQKTDCVTIKEAAEKEWSEDLVSFHTGSHMVGEDVVLIGMTRIADPYANENQDKLVSDAVEAAKDADVVVMPIGEHFSQSGEAASRAMIEIPEIQMELFRKVYEVNKNIVTLVFSGRPLDLREISAKSKAVLMVWMPGTEGGPAIVNTLLGRSNPSGKLPMSFPYSVGQCPVHYNYFSTGRPEKKGVLEKFKSRYLDIPNEPLYPFGYGLSYTTFEMDQLTMSADTMTKEETLDVSVRVRNTGSGKGTEVVQLYIRDDVASIARPVRELKGFERVTLEPGEERIVSFKIDDKALAFVHWDGRKYSEPGTFTIFVGNEEKKFTLNQK